MDWWHISYTRCISEVHCKQNFLKHTKDINFFFNFFMLIKKIWTYLINYCLLTTMLIYWLTVIICWSTMSRYKFMISLKTHQNPESVCEIKKCETFSITNWSWKHQTFYHIYFWSVERWGVFKYRITFKVYEIFFSKICSVRYNLIWVLGPY